MGIPWDAAVLIKKLKNIFGYDNFKNVDQEKTVTEVLKGESDVYINLPPGAGKSICFQLPAILKRYTLTVVFVPTNSLGKNQIDFLKQRGINVEYLCPGTWKHLHKDLSLRSDKMELQFLYASTDKRTRDFVNTLITKLNSRNATSLIVFDEAHCISRLSHDYVPTYRDVAESIKILFPSIRKIALTGTATLEVTDDIILETGMIKPREIVTSCQWVAYQDVRFIDTLLEPFNDLKDFISENLAPSEKSSQNPPKCGIIFCRKKQATEIIARELGAINIPVVSYHGDLSMKDRVSIHDRWIAGEISVIATTRKFGIGLHGPNVRFVVHWSMPMSIQQIYQETGRCSQDGDKSSCRVYFSNEEEDNITTHIKSLKNMPSQDIDVISRKHKFFNEVIDYCLETKCRHVAQQAYFEKRVPRCQNYCDACHDWRGLKNRIYKFLSFRSLSKQIIIHRFAFARARRNLNNPPEPVPITPYHERFLERLSLTSRAARKARQRSYKRLLGELTDNYKKTRTEVEKNIEDIDISEVARRLEYSLCMGAITRQKYNNDVVQAVRSIKSFSASELSCGYVRYYRPEERSIYEAKPSVIDLVDVESDDDQLVENPANINVKSPIVVVDLVDESDSGSETP